MTKDYLAVPSTLRRIEQLLCFNHRTINNHKKQETIDAREQTILSAKFVNIKLA